MKKGTLVSMLVGVLIFVLLGAFVMLRISSDNKNNSEISGKGRPEGRAVITLSGKDDTDAIVDKLHSAGVIRDKSLFINYMEERKLSLHSADVGFELQQNSSYNSIIEEINKNATIKILIPEGFELRQVVDRLVEKGIGTSERYGDVIANYDYDYSYIKTLPKGANRLEGYLFPDTYQFFGDEKEEVVIGKMLSNFDARTKKIRENLTGSLSFTEVITLASIIERESGRQEDVRQISSVFYNRMKKNMPLQSCATIEYVLQERKKVLSIADTQIDSVYNTYIHKGLTPTPIANPGMLSIEAAVNPAETNYYYFKLNSEGVHVFSRTLQEHNAVQ